MAKNYNVIRLSKLSKTYASNVFFSRSGRQEVSVAVISVLRDATRLMHRRHVPPGTKERCAEMILVVADERLSSGSLTSSKNNPVRLKRQGYELEGTVTSHSCVCIAAMSQVQKDKTAYQPSCILVHRVASTYTTRLEYLKPPW